MRKDQYPAVIAECPPAALLRLAGSVLVETHDEWQFSDSRYLSESSMALLNPTTGNTKEVATPALLTA